VRIATGILLAFVAAAPLLEPAPLRGALQEAPLPDRDAFLARLRAGIRADDELRKDFTYTERRRDVKVSPLGKMSVGPLRTFEVFPSPHPGQTYKRLIAIDGRPLTEAELQARDAEHQRDLENEERRQRRETPAQQARRLERLESERRNSRAILADALAVFEASLLARETIDGETTIAVSLTPRANARVTTREGGWMKQFAGRAWFVEADAQLARLDMQATDDVSIGWGIVGRLHKGSRIVVERKRVDRLWLPSRLTFVGTGRTLLFRTFELNLVTEYFDYKRRSARQSAVGSRQSAVVGQSPVVGESGVGSRESGAVGLGVRPVVALRASPSGPGSGIRFRLRVGSGRRLEGFGPQVGAPTDD
jgi:hypothetical protein